MADKYLNKTGLQYFFNRIKTIFAEKTEITITTVKRNGTALTPDANKAVNVSVPITGIKRNGTTVNPSSYVVDISVPTTVAELSDATSYALKTDLSSKIDVFGTEIPASSNLNNYVTSGQFWCTQANASGLTNSPTTKPFVLWVARADSDDTSTRTVQLVYELNTPFRLYVRGCVSNTWRDWENIAYIDDIPTTVAELTDASTYAKKTDITITGIKVNNSTVTPSNKVVNITVPTNNNQLTNGAGYQTSSQVQALIDTAVSSTYRYKGSVANAAALPSSGQSVGDVYDLQDTGMNVAWNGSAWDNLGSVFDSSGLWAKTELTAITTAEIDTITA